MNISQNAELTTSIYHIVFIKIDIKFSQPILKTPLTVGKVFEKEKGERRLDTRLCLHSVSFTHEATRTFGDIRSAVFTKKVLH